MDFEKRNDIYGRVFADVSGHVDRQKMQEACSIRSYAVRNDVMQELLRRAVIDSSVMCYNGMPHVFTGRIYERFDWNMLVNLVYDIMRWCGVPDGNYSPGRIRNLSWLLSSVVRDKLLDVNPSLMVFSNCVLDTELREVYEFSPRHMAVTKVDYPYMPDEVPMRWQKFLDRVLPDMKMQHILQEFLGAVFVNRKGRDGVNDLKVDKMLVLLGNGANGKSVVFETMRGVMGAANVKSFNINSLIRGGDQQKNRATINGARLNYCSDVSLGRMSDSERADLKKLLSGEPMEARFIQKDPFEACDIPLMMANANQMPAMGDSSFSMRRRFVILPFKVTIPRSERDPGLAGKLKKDYPGIFNWIMRGRERFVANNHQLSISEDVEEVMDSFQAQCSTVLRFMLDRGYKYIYPDKSHDPIEVSAANLMADYHNWCLDEQIAPEDIANKWKFGLELKAANYRAVRHSEGIFYIIYPDNIDKVKAKFKQLAADEGRRKKETKQDIRPFTENGRRWVRTRFGIAQAIGCNEDVIQKLKSAGKLNGCYRYDTKDVRTVVYDLQLTRKAVMEHRAAMKSTEEDKEERRKLAIKRHSFNARCKELDLPFRKYDKNLKGDLYFTWNDDGLVLVPDDWQLGEEVPYELLPKKPRKFLDNITEGKYNDKLKMVENYEKFRKEKKAVEL